MKNRSMGQSFVVAWLLLGGVAVAAPKKPSGYQCDPGTRNAPLGCTCPAGYASGRDDDNIAVCVAKESSHRTPASTTSSPPSATSAAVSGHAKYTRTTTIKISVPSLDAFKLVPTTLPMQPSLSADDSGALAKATNAGPDGPAHWYGMYKTAWLHMQAGKYQDAMDAFRSIVEGTKSDATQAALNRAAKTDFLRAYLEIGDPQKAYAALWLIDDSQAVQLTNALGDLYLARGDGASAMAVFRNLITVAPQDAKICRWYIAIARANAFAPNANAPEVVVAVKDLIGAVAADRGPSARACRDKVATFAGGLARTIHNDAAKTKNPALLPYAEALYRAYLDAFADAPDAAEDQYFLAEAVWAEADAASSAQVATQLWESAALAFTEVVRTNKLDPRIIKESAYAAVLSWKNALSVDPRVKHQSGDAQPTQPEPIPDREQKMIAAFDIYITYIKDPNDDERIGMMFLKANIFRRYGHFAEAIPLFRDIVKNHPAHETAEYSVNLLLDIYNRLGKYDEMLAFADEMLADPKILADRDDLKATLVKLKQQGLRKRAEVLEKQGKDGNDKSKFIECGKAYLDAYNAEPDADAIDEVLYNASVCYEEAGELAQADRVRVILIDRYPNGRFTPFATLPHGRYLMNTGDMVGCGTVLEGWATRYSGEKDAPQAMYEAAACYEKAGKHDDAVRVANLFLKVYSKSKARVLAQAQLFATLFDKDEGLAGKFRRLLGQ